MIIQLITLGVLLIGAIIVPYFTDKRIKDLELRNEFLYLNLDYENNNFNEDLFHIFKSIKLKSKSWKKSYNYYFNDTYGFEYRKEIICFFVNTGIEVPINEKEKELLRYLFIMLKQK